MFYVCMCVETDLLDHQMLSRSKKRKLYRTDFGKCSFVGFLKQSLNSETINKFYFCTLLLFLSFQKNLIRVSFAAAAFDKSENCCNGKVLTKKS